MDQRTRKLITMHKALNSRHDVDRQYVSRKERKSGLDSIEDSVDASIQRLEDYVEKRRGRLITNTRNNIDNTRTSRTEITRKQKWGKNPNSMDVLSDISREKTWTWPRKENLKREIESVLVAV